MASFKDIEPSGKLVLEDEDGAIRKYMFKEVEYVLPSPPLPDSTKTATQQHHKMNQTDKQILHIAVPSIVSNITVPLLGLVDVTIVGHLGSAAYIGML